MSAYIDKFRELKPAFKDSTDEELIPYLHEKYASDMPISEFYKKIGVEDPNAPGDISRGFSTGMEQLKQTGYGILAAGGATAEHFLGEGGISTGIKKAGLAGYQEQEAKIAETAKPSDEAIYSWEKAKEGDFGALGDWLQYGIGQAGSQAVQALATAGLGGFIAKAGVQTVGKELAAKLVESQAAKIAETEATKIAAGELTKEAIEQQATKMVAEKIGNIGAKTALGGLAVTQEGGEIGGDLVAKAEKKGRPLTGDELAKAFGYSLGAGALEFVGDKFGLDVLTGKTKFGKTIGGMKGIGGRVARGTVAGLTTAPIEAGTEYGQTLLEEAGKGNDPFSEQARKNAINAGFAGAFGGHVMGMAGGMLTAPIATATNVDDAIVNAEKALSKPTVNEPQKLIPQLVFDKEGNSYDRNELLRNFIAQGNDEASANAYIDKITTPEIKTQPLDLAPYRELQAKNAGILGIKQPASEADIEAINERLAIQAEATAPEQPFDDRIPFSQQTKAQIADEWEQQDLANELEKQQALPQDIEARKRLLGIQPVQPIKPIAETKAPTVQPKPVEFTPTHQLNDGTPVIKVAGENNVYTDVSGNEWEADDAVPIVAQKQVPAVEQKIKKQPIAQKQESAKKLFNVNGVQVDYDKLTPEQKTAWNEADVEHALSIKYAGQFNAQDRGKQIKASGMRLSAKRREIIGALTAKEQEAQSKKESVIRNGDIVIHAEFGNGIVKSNPAYGKAKVQFGDNEKSVNLNELVKQTKIEPTIQQPRKGTVGGKLSAGEVVITSSGRQTTPFPKFQTKEGNTKPVHLKAVDKWLMRNAFEEAKARGDEFNARQFENNLDKPSQADKDSAEEYLFGEQPVVEKPLVKEKSFEMEDLKSQMGQAIGELASLLGGKTNLTEEEETKLIPIMSKIFRIAAKMGYVKFKDAAQHVMSQIRELAGDEVADKLSIENLQAGYINIAKEIGGDKREALQYESIEELEGDKNAVEKQETTQPNGSRSAQPRVREEGEDTTEGRAGIREGGQEERDISQDLIDVFNKLGKQGISKSGESLIKQRSNADIITAVQNHWLDVLADVGYEKESKSDNPNGKVFIQC